MVWVTSEDPTDRPGRILGPHEALPCRGRSPPRCSTVLLTALARRRRGPRPCPRRAPPGDRRRLAHGEPRGPRPAPRPAGDAGRVRRGVRTRPATPWSARAGWPATGTGAPAAHDAARGLLRHQVGHQRPGRHRGARRVAAPRRPGRALRPAVARHPVGGVTVRNLLSNDSGRYWSIDSDYGALVARPQPHGVRRRPAAAARARQRVGLQQRGHPGARGGAAPGDRHAGRPVRARRLFAPLGMTHTRMVRDASGRSTTIFFGLQTTCLDLARLGTLYLGGARWPGGGS